MRVCTILTVALFLTVVTGCAKNNHEEQSIQLTPKAAYKLVGQDICFSRKETFTSLAYTKTSTRLSCHLKNIEYKPIPYSSTDDRILIDGEISIEHDKTGRDVLLVKKEGLFFEPENQKILRWIFSGSKPARGEL